MSDNDKNSALVQLYNDHAQTVKRESVRRVQMAACGLAAVAVINWLILAISDAGWIVGPVTAGSIGAPIAAVGLSTAAAVTSRTLSKQRA